MYQKILTDPKFFLLLFKYDLERASELHSMPCKHCGGKLDWANYARQPRGGPPDLDEKCKVRFSLCCRNEGCRKRVMPPSLRFLGARVYFSAIFSLVIALSQGARPEKIEKIQKEFNISHQTFLRWRQWWKEVFPVTRFWQREKGIHSTSELESDFPYTLLKLFCRLHMLQESLCNFLRFISPLPSYK